MLEKIYYPGTAADWKAVTVGEENEALHDVEIIYEK